MKFVKSRPPYLRESASPEEYGTLELGAEILLTFSQATIKDVGHDFESPVIPPDAI